MAVYKDISDLKKQIADFKRAVHSTNSDYLTGYICALSAVEGMIAGLPDADVVKVVRCKDCKHFKPAFFKADDGTETPWDGTFSFDERSDGIHYGARCKHERNTAYGQKDMAFRNAYDFCSYGERKDNETL